MLNISDQDFHRLVNYVKSNYGIDLSKKRQLISGRLSNTITNMGYSDFTGYVDHIVSGKNAKDNEIMLNKLTTNYTYFYREKTHFDYFRDTILPYIVKTKEKNRVMSIWSAGCSSGEEPYTITMLIREFLGAQANAWDTRILATDISHQVLAKAKNGLYEEESLRELPSDWKRKYFIPVKGAPGTYEVSKPLRSNVIYRTFNLMSPIHFKLKFDVIFCRNVMIYFDQDTKEALVKRFYQASNPGAYLLIGHSENLNKERTPYDYIMPATYRKSEDSK